MTLIKSTDGTGWVEARVGDYVNYKWGGEGVSMSAYFTVEKIDSGFLLWNNACEGIVSTECQLIERPFQVGDNFDTKYYHPDLPPGDAWCRGGKIWNDAVLQVVISDPLNHRHSSPLLHPVENVCATR